MGLLGRTDHEYGLDPDEQSSVRQAANRFARWGQDLPFVPIHPYEPRQLQLGWRALLLATLVAAAFFGTVSSEPLWQDERILHDIALRSWGGIGAIWANPFDQSIPPTVRSLNWMVSRCAGIGAVPSRLVSLTFHAIALTLLWFSLRRLNATGAWLAAAVLAVHPALLPTVGWISRQADVVAAACAMTAIWSYFVARDIRPALNESVWTDPDYHPDDEVLPRWPWVLFGLAMLAGIFSGSMAIAIAPTVLLIIDWKRESRLPWLLQIGLVSLVILSIAAAGWYAGLPAVAKVETTVSAGASLFQVLLPVEQPFVFDRSQWSAGWTGTAAACSGALLLVALLSIRRTWAKLALMGLALAIAHGAFAKSSEAAAIVLADIVAYPALLVLIPIFVIAMLSFATGRLSRPMGLAVRWGAGLLLVIGFGALSVIRSPAYAGADAIWQHALAVQPDGVIAREELANRYLAEGFLEEAADQLDRVPKARRDVHWLLSRGKAFEALKRYNEAANCYETAHRLQPDDTKILILFAEAQASAGRSDEAAKLYDQVLQQVKNDPGLYTNAGLAQLRLGQPQAAADLYEKALAVDPGFLPAHINLANVLFDLGKFEASATHLQEAVRIDPRNFAAFMNAGILLYRLRDYSKAERMFRAAVNLDGTSPDAFDNLGIVLAAEGRLSDAAWSFTQATRLNPDHRAADHLAEVRRQLREKAATQPRPAGIAR